MLNNNNEDENSVSINMSESENTERVVPHIFRCPISTEIMEDPVINKNNGKFYDKEFILGWLKKIR